eukprot:TRINITY_DN5252_c1_g1_i1.p1 TRINITY_DN5252_c1_g1~~TRINITY_DN5252_c1_g1_i1.p1  ORF type:complete len:360 (+),score=37.64 TRINITY_DN5252_c1_g1_i1:46-1125(+)
MSRRRCCFCPSGDGKFTCPRCNQDYCSLSCYQSRTHQRCSEDFYKECVQAELGSTELGPEARSQMQSILARINNTGDSTAQDSEDSVDSDDDEEEVDLAERLAGIDLDDTDKVWEKLSASERREFNALLGKGEVDNLLPEFEPWWNTRVSLPKIQELSSDEVAPEPAYKKNSSPVCQRIPPLPPQLQEKASPYIKFGILNLLYAYAYAVRYFYGDYTGCSEQFVEIVELLAGSLRGQNYELADTAVEAAASSVNLHNHIAVSLDFSRSVKKDVYNIAKGPAEEDLNFYILAGLSDLRSQYLDVIKRGKNKDPKSATRCPPSRFAEKSPELDTKELKLHLKKIEFYLSYSQFYRTAFSQL